MRLLHLLHILGALSDIVGGTGRPSGAAAPGIYDAPWDVAPDSTGLVQARLGREVPSTSAASTGPIGLFSERKRQRMLNYDDLQYFTHITVGGQELTGIIDTGSFELVVFEGHCGGCGAAGKYNKLLSDGYREGALHKGLFYGSGDVYAREAFDAVSVGPFGPVNLSFWEGYEAYMPVLEQARFQSIIGVGPPETPASESWAEVRTRIDKIGRSLGKGLIPEAPVRQGLLDNVRFSVAMSRTPTMLRAFNVSMFSVCLGKRPGSAGYFVWDDRSALEQHTLFKRVPVIGKHTWTVNLTNVRLGHNGRVVKDDGGLVVPLGCSGGCAAVVDSGTSLLMMPSAYVERLERTVEQLGLNCDSLHELPDLIFELGGHEFSLPPDAYLAEVAGTTTAGMERRSKRPPADHGEQCEVAVMESVSETPLGPLWIIGMPFFRKYYTTFNTGGSCKERALFAAPASTSCRPAVAEVVLAADRTREVFRRRVNLSNAYLPPLVRRAVRGGLIEL